MFHPHKLASAVTLALSLAGVAHAGSKPFDNVVVFGDSLSDAGNLPNTAGDYTKFTTNPGKVAVQDVADTLGFNLTPSRDGGSDYAYGGAGITTNSDPAPQIQTITQQITGYLAGGHRADPRSLYMIWGGPNDIFYHSTQYGVGTIFPGAGETAAQATANINAAASQELVLINQLKAAGANYLVVFNLPDIGATPSAQANEALVPGIKSFLTGVSQSYNQILNAGLGDHTLAVNTYALFDQVLADPARYGFVNVTTPACTTSSSHDCDGSTLVAPGADQNYLFADGVHPTSGTHAMLAQVVLSELQAPGQISLLPEASLAAARAYGSSLDAQMVKDSLGEGTRAFVNISYAEPRFGRRRAGRQSRDRAHAWRRRPRDDRLFGAGLRDVSRRRRLCRRLRSLRPIRLQWRRAQFPGRRCAHARNRRHRRFPLRRGRAGRLVAQPGRGQDRPVRRPGLAGHHRGQLPRTPRRRDRDVVRPAAPAGPGRPPRLASARSLAGRQPGHGAVCRTGLEPRQQGRCHASGDDRAEHHEWLVRDQRIPAGQGLGQHHSRPVGRADPDGHQLDRLQRALQ